MTATFQIRRCRKEDFEGVLLLLQQLWPDKNLDAAALRKVFDYALAADRQIYLCAIDGENVIGFVSMTVKNSLWQAASLGHIDELVVDQQYRRRRLGTQLLDAIVGQAREAGCSRVELDSAFHRKEAHRFYEQHDFENRAYLFSRKL
jgi:glucosamine-phosphate N-acetyltransferase